MKAFVYPKEMHKRGPDPGPFKDYRTYKPYLRDEFKGACVYCRLRDSLNREASFAVEHHMPQNPFTDRITDWTNLYYACLTCNAAKGNFYPKGSRRKIDYVPTPCSDVMFHHLRYQGSKVVSHSETGNFVANLLDLNEQKTVEYREFFQRVLDEAKVKLAEWDRAIADIEKALKVAAGTRKEKLSEGLRKAQNERIKVDVRLRYILGPY